jgi:hypothetical protein
MTRVEKVSGLVGALLFMSMAGVASASETASATISASPVAGGFQYNIALKNTSADSTQIGSFWFSWLPPVYDFMNVSPTNVTSPTGWNNTIVHDAGEGFSIEWVNGGGAGDQLLANATDNFSFQTTETPSQVAGPGAGPIGNFYSQTASYVYAGAPEAPGDNGFFLSNIPISVPEPMSASIVAIGAAGLMIRRRRQMTNVGA